MVFQRRLFYAPDSVFTKIDPQGWEWRIWEDPHTFQREIEVVYCNGERQIVPRLPRWLRTEYYRHKAWRNRKAWLLSVLGEGGRRCPITGLTSDLEFHHRTDIDGYRRLGREEPEDVVVVHYTVHQAIHAKPQPGKRTIQISMTLSV